MKRIIKGLALLAILHFTSAAYAEMESGTRTLSNYSVNLASTDSATRAASYLSALYEAYPELTGSMKVKAERIDSLLGGLVTFTQEFNGIEFYKSKMWIRVFPNGTVNYVGGNYHENCELCSESFLSDTSDLQALRNTVRPSCQGWDSINLVKPAIYPRENPITKEIEYRYALIAHSDKAMPTRVIDWSSGELLEEWTAKSNTCGHIGIRYRPGIGLDPIGSDTPEDDSDDYEPCDNCAYVRGFLECTPFSGQSAV